MANITIFETQNVMGFSLNSFYGAYHKYISPMPFHLVEGDEYIIFWDGGSYTRTAFTFTNPSDGTSCTAVGNKIVYTGENDGDPFAIVCDTTNDCSHFFSTDTKTEHHICIYHVVGGDLDLKDRMGNRVDGINDIVEVKIPTVDGGLRSFTAGERVKTTVDLDFSNDDVIVVTPGSGTVFSEVSIKKPEGLVPGAIAKDVVVAGIVGEYEGGSDDGFAAMLERTIVDLVVPEVSVASYAFYNNKLLETANVYSVGACTFQGCTMLKTVTINGEEGDLTSTFNGCSELESVYAPNLITSTGSVNANTFSNCKKLKTFNAPKAFFGAGTFACAYMFQNCTALTEIVFPAQGGYHSFSEYMFSGCTSLQKVDIHEKVMLNTQNIFNNCTALTAIIMRGDTCYNPYSAATSTSTKNFLYNCPAIFYVPSAVYSKYEANAKWKTFIDAGRLFCIEDYPDICG